MEYLSYISSDVVRRTRHPVVLFFRRMPLITHLVVFTPRKVLAANTIPFTPITTVTPAQATSIDQEGGNLHLDIWVNRGMTIRGGNSVYQCLANLTAALELVGQLNAAEYNGAASALSLLPTAGALLGAPTREMWIVYKLVPLAGVLSMFLSLGGSITPSNVGDYDPAEPFSYGGFMPTTAVKTRPDRENSRPQSVQTFEAIEAQDDVSAADLFAKEVFQRAEDDRGGGVTLGVASAIVLQFILVIGLLIPMWYAQRGSVVTWWCRVLLALTHMARCQ